MESVPFCYQETTGPFPSGQGIQTRKKAKTRKKAGRSSRKGKLLLCKSRAGYVEEVEDDTIPRACCAVNVEEAGG